MSQVIFVSDDSEDERHYVHKRPIKPSPPPSQVKQDSDRDTGQNDEVAAAYKALQDIRAEKEELKRRLEVVEGRERLAVERYDFEVSVQLRQNKKRRRSVMPPSQPSAGAKMSGKKKREEESKWLYMDGTIRLHHEPAGVPVPWDAVG